MLDLAGLAMHQVTSANHVAAECSPDRLMSQADAENWRLSCHMTNQLHADAGVVRRARPRGDDDPLWPHALDLRGRDLIVAAHLNLLPQFAQILHQVVGEGIVVIED